MSGILLATVGNSYGSAPVNAVAPVVSGTAAVGQTLSTTNGTWTGAPAPTFTYQWQRSAVNISGATSSTYVLVAADYANTIRCVVKATNSIAPSGVTANSNSTASVAGAAPVNTVAPAVTGTASFGSTLTTTDGTWTGTPTPTFTYQWQRVSTNISGATSSTYVLVAADVGNTIRCVVTGTNAVSAVSANSNSTASVAAIVPDAPTIGTATISFTTASVPFTAPASNGGATITSYTATSSPSGITGTLSQAGSGTVTVSGLVGGTSYTFTVTATNSAGTGAASAASNSVAAIAAGQQLFTAFGSTSWTAPAGVTSVSVVAIGTGGNGGQAAGNLSYINNYSVTPGNSYTVNLIQGDKNLFVNTSTLFASSGTNKFPTNVGGNTPQASGSPIKPGGGAAGYAGDGGAGSGGDGDSGNPGNSPGSAGAGGGGGGGGYYVSGGGDLWSGAGGGVGALGQGSNGAGGTFTTGGGGGSGGTTGGVSGNGGGAGIAGSFGGSVTSSYNSTTSTGAIRIIWPGSSRSFPSTNTANV